MDLDDSPWGDNDKSLQDAEWSKLSSDFVNAGYREGITAGKEAALQQGFDEGFAHTGAPIGRQLGLLRGFSAALVVFLSSARADTTPPALLDEARAISLALSDVRFSDVAPPDPQAEEHAREHLKSAEDVVTSEELREKRDMESLEDMMNRMGAGQVSTEDKRGRPTMEDVQKLEGRLVQLAQAVGLSLPSST
jgi:hypothetical protein